MKLNIIKYYYIKNKKLIFNNINKNFIFKKYIIIKLFFYEYINNKLKIFNFKGIFINNNSNNNIILLKYNNNDILFLYFYLNIFNLITILKLGKLNLNKIKFLI
ncbi:hypothetical protein PGAL8A_API04400 (apicoplast) [Plasmodium gallinaceum]|uniref:Open reading frame 101 n=1 Tax=Plasmodium gallinaceum TaxID=5849 RepID=H7CDZ3_PLAGA|nr:hypothetical protein PGAL8A_API04400 [Plasmodium gallinaceum]BAL70763.1 open reading frame 101 [Plasmodium gallinaceum]CRG98254.1 hypothetical protein PGAL8A_API04400 [Plasmodium gallinaceum]